MPMPVAAAPSSLAEYTASLVASHTLIPITWSHDLVYCFFLLPAPPAGTPSLISLPLLEQLLAALDARFGIAAGAEISIEADPGTFDAASLRSYLGLGVTRVSVGVQVCGLGRLAAPRPACSSEPEGCQTRASRTPPTPTCPFLPAAAAAARLAAPADLPR